MLLAAASLAAEDFKIIVHEHNGQATLSRAEASDLFLKKRTHWNDGTAVLAVDQSVGTAVRASLSSQIHGKTVVAVKSYWQQQIFSGRDIPPVEKASDEQVLAFVRANPGAIGYVSQSASTAGVKVVVVQ